MINSHDTRISFLCQSLQQLLHPAVVIDAHAGPAGHPAVEVDADRGDGGMGGGGVDFHRQAYGVPAGTGGDTVCLAVKINTAATHTAIAPVCVNFHCWVARRAGVRIYDDGRVEQLL